MKHGRTVRMEKVFRRTRRPDGVFQNDGDYPKSGDHDYADYLTSAFRLEAEIRVLSESKAGIIGRHFRTNGRGSPQRKRR